MAMAGKVTEQTTIRIMCIGWAGPSSEPAPSGLHLPRYDPDGNGGQGAAAWTEDPDRVLQFASMSEAHACYAAFPASRPVRPDGKPKAADRLQRHVRLDSFAIGAVRG